jgi:hypothetical protein
MVIVLVAFLDVLFFSEFLSVHVMCALFLRSPCDIAVVLVMLMIFQKNKAISKCTQLVLR